MIDLYVNSSFLNSYLKKYNKKYIVHEVDGVSSIKLKQGLGWIQPYSLTEGILVAKM